jgi:glycosyltransferase involved in cell wall biosynthesis
VPFNGIDPRVIDREQAEYEEADAITVPSIFSRRSFIEMGVPQEKLRVLPYGVNLGRFSKVASPDPHRFDILFVGGMSLQKGIPYLLQAYLNLQHPGKSLTFAGAPSPDLISSMQRRQLWPTDAKVLGHVPQADLKHLMSRSHVMVLPSVQDGFGMVMAQAMASGCPVIASRNTGAEDLFEDGIEGFVVPIRDAGALSEKLQWMADHPADRDAMGQQALRKVRGLGGWQDYGQRAIGILQELAGHA